MDGKVKQYNQQFDISQLLREIVEFNTFEANQKGLLISLDFENISSTSCSIIGDVNKIKQIIQVLITNSIKYTIKGKIKIKASQMIIDNRSSIKIDVEDSGPGIDPLIQNKIFKLFGNLSFKSNINQSGTGVGLTYCKHLCQIIGASIDFKSESGVGTTFTIIINADLLEASPFNPLQ